MRFRLGEERKWAREREEEAKARKRADREARKKARAIEEELNAAARVRWAEHQARAIERIVSEGDRAFFAVRPEVAKIRTQGRGA